MKRLFRKSVAGTLGLEVSPFGVAAAYLAAGEDGQQDSASCAFFEGAISASRSSLEAWLTERSLQQVQTQVVLHPTMYQVYFVDRPEVEQSELAEAVRWKIKDLIDEPLKDLIVDAFAVPEDAYRGNQKKVYAVAMSKTVLEETVAQLNRLPIVLKGISISELADRAMLNRFYSEGGGAALLRLRGSNGTINLIDGGDLYLTRGIETGVSLLESAHEDDRQTVMDSLLLEIQRCLDYYDSQLGKSAIRKMLVAPTKLSRNFFDDHLRGHLDLAVNQLDLNDFFRFEERLSGDLQSTFFGAVAAASGLIAERAS